MCDESDVQSVLAGAVAAACFPNGTAQPSITGTKIIVQPGWPNDDALSDMVSKGYCRVTVFPKNIERNTTRYGRDPQIIQNPTTTITATVAGGTVTLSGITNPRQNVAIIVNGKGYVHTVQPTETLGSIATALASALAVDIAGTTSTGAVITVGAGASSIAARVGGFGTAATELSRQEKVFAITLWAPSPSLRATMASAIKPALDLPEFLMMPDGFAGRCLYENSFTDDGLQKTNVYRRDLNYRVEYATTIEQQAAAVILPVVNVGSFESTNTFTKII